jgi:hypothetical protein
VIVECDVPPESALEPGRLDAAYFRDSYRAPLTRGDLGIVEIFAALFGHAPAYVKLLLRLRNALAKAAGLDVPSRADMTALIRGPYRVGDTIGPWPVFSITEREIVAGRDNRHLDFRVSVLKQADGAAVTVTTVCTVHNLAGRLYLFFIVPFHRFGVRSLMSNAVASGRL